MGVDTVPPIAETELDAPSPWWEAANFLTVAQIYLQDNSLRIYLATESSFGTAMPS